MAQLSLWMNPTMPYRHLHPRAAGSMVFKGGGSTTNVTNTGLGDDQYTAIMDNLATNFEQSDVRYEEVRPLLDNMGVDTDQLLTDLTSLSSAQSTGFTNIQDLLGQYDLANQGRTDTITQNQGTTQSQIGQLSTDVDTGFGNVQGDITSLGADVSNRFDTVDQANTNIQSAVDTGFGDQATAFSDLNTRMDTELQSRNEAFTNVGDQLGEVENNLDAGQTSVQQNVLSSISDLSGNVDTVGSNLDAYYSGLSDGQGRMENNQAEFKSSFDTYVDRYGEDTSLANQKRLDIQDQLVGGVQGIRNDIGVNANTTNTNIGNLADATGSGFDNTSAGLSSVGQMLTTGFDATSGTLNTQAKDLLGVAGQLDGIDQSTKNAFNSVSNAFDAQGNLITSATDEMGNSITRSIDANGNLLETTMDANTGEILSENSLNVNQVMNSAANFQGQLVDQIGGFRKETSQGFTSLNDVVGQGFQNTDSALTRGFQNTNSAISGGFQNAANEYDQQGTMIRNGFATQVDNIAKVAQGIQGLDQNMVGNFGLMAEAFDDTGELVQSTINADGTITQRTIDNNGILRMDRFTNQGQYLGSSGLSVMDTLGQMQGLTQNSLMAAQ